MHRMLSDIEDGLRGGDRFSDCVDRHPKVFPEFYRGILRSAELTGELDTVLSQLSDYLERDLEARRKIKSALMYPAIVALMSLGTVAVLAGWVLPKFKEFFASLDAELPLATRALLAMTDFMTQFWWVLLGGAVGAAVLGFLFVRTSPGRLFRDRLLLRLPVIGDTIRHALIERFCRILASMVSAGVTLPQALSVASDSLRNRVYTGGLAHVQEQMLEGEGIAGPLAESNLFPPTAVRMVRVGEDTGTLDTQLGVAATYYERELDHKIKKVTTLIEPAVIIFMGLLVGFVAIALVSAMYGIFRQVNL
jgi:type IV pilus assembly protein PilC